jgi:MATE family multidrug resistance protein
MFTTFGSKNGAFMMYGILKGCIFAEIMNVRNRQIWNLALPSIISNITVPLLGLVDVSIVGHIGDARYISAIAIGTMIFNVIYWIFGFLRMGTGGMTSQAYGHRDFSEVTRLLVRTLSIGFGIGTLFVLLQTPVIGLGLWMMSPQEDMIGLCEQYCRVVIWGAPAMLSLYGMTGWYVGMQNTKIPMLVSVMQNVVNIIVSLFLVFILHLGIEGVAGGTVIAQWSGFVLAIVLVRRYYGRLWPYLGDWRLVFSKQIMKKFFVVNRDIFLRTLFLVAVMLFFTAAGSRQGALILAVNTLLMQFFTIFSYFSDGFAYAGEALGGKYVGAGNKMAFWDMVNHLFLMGAWMTIGFTLLYIVAGPMFLHLLTSDQQVIAASSIYFHWAEFIPLVGITAFLFDGLFVGTTQTKGLLLSSIIAASAFFIIYFCLKNIMANHALWLAFIVYLAVRGIVELIVYRHIPFFPNH